MSMSTPCSVSHLDGKITIFQFLQHFLSAQIEKKLLSDFSLKLFEFFCENRKRQEIQVRNVQDLVGILRQMFLEKQTNVSISNTSKLLPEVKTVAFTDLLEDDLEENGLNYIESIKEYARSGPSKIQRVEFRTVFQEKTTPNSDIRDFVEEQNAAFSEFGWSLEYECYDGHYHQINAKMLKFEKPQNLKVNTVWTPKCVSMECDDDAGSHSVAMTLSMDIDSEIMDDFSEEKKEQFTKFVVESFLKQTGVDLQSEDLKVVIGGVDAGSLHINYHLVSNSVDISESAIEIIAEGDATVEMVEFESMTLPVTGNKERKLLSLAEDSMKSEVAQFERDQAERRRLNVVLAVERKTWPRWTGRSGRRLVKKVQSLLANGEPVWEECEMAIIRDFCIQKQSSKYVFLPMYLLLFRVDLIRKCSHL